MLILAFLLFTFSLRSVSSDCLTNPQNTNCTNFVLPNVRVEEDIKMLCDMMQNMPGCSVQRICASGDDFSSSPYCQSFSIYKDLCLDMGGMDGCEDYRSMCTNDSVIQECQVKALPIPSYSAAADLIKQICESMNMPGCNTCGSDYSDCEVLVVYSNLCKSMPEMSQCQQWQGFCSLIPDWPLCSSTSSDPPLMRMFFHLGITDYVLFEKWVPRTTAQYVGTWFCVLFMGILFELFKLLRYRCEKHWNKSSQDQNTSLMRNQEGETLPPSGDEITYENQAFQWKVDFPRSCLSFVEVGWSLVLMLVAMTYNVGLFIALCLGAMIGTLLFGRFYHYKIRRSCH